MGRYYVYAYVRANGTPYYVGKGKGRRRFDWRGKAAKPPTDKNLILLLRENLTESAAFQWEMNYIRYWGRKDIGTGILRNKSDGGEGASGAVRTDWHKQRVSETHQGKVMSEETRAKIRAARLRQRMPAWSPEARERQAAALRGVPKSEAHKAAMRGPRTKEQTAAATAARRARAADLREKLKPKVVAMLLAGATQRQIYAALRVSPNIITEWRAELREQGEAVRPARGWNKAPEGADRFDCGRLKIPMNRGHEAPSVTDQKA